MSKERLEELLDDLAYIVIHSGKLEPLKQFAREQAERVQELERQNKRYREAIKGAIGKFNYDYHQEGMAELRNALEESE